MTVLTWQESSSLDHQVPRNVTLQAYARAIYLLCNHICCLADYYSYGKGYLHSRYQ